MNKRMRELQALINEKTEQVKGFMSGETKDLDKANTLMDEIEALQKEFDLEERMLKASKAGVPAEPETPAAPKADSVKAFADAARNGFKATMTEGVPADGGYTVPEDIVTRIQELRQAKVSMLQYVTVVPVKTNKGSRTFKARAQQTGFTKVGEGGKIGAGKTPQFTRVSYEIEKYAGYFPVTAELLADSDADITDVLTGWIADESRVTANNLILAAVKTKETEMIEDLDAIKKALNVTLGSAFKSTSVIFTNDDGLQWLDTLKNADEEYLLQVNPSDPMKLQLSAGGTVVPVVVLPNSDVPSSNDVIPFVIGDLKEGIIYWDRQQMSIRTSDVAAIGDLNAYEEDLVLFRAIEREDVTVRDEAAFVVLGVQKATA